MAVKTQMTGRVSAACAATALAVSALVASPTIASAATDPLEIRLDPSYQGPAFQGWGTSLAWFAEATGDYPEELRQELFEKVFGEEGLNLNIARYNIGGGNSTDTPNYMRPGAAPQGWWAPELTIPDWDPIKAEYANKAAYNDEWDGTNDEHFNFDADQTQRWWVEQAATRREDMVWEAFSNSPPWFMTESGYTSGPFVAGADQLTAAQAEDFANYLVRVVEHLETEYGIEIGTLDPFNQPLAAFPRTTITNGVVSGRQEGAPMTVGLQQAVIAAVAERIQNSSSDVEISATDASQAAHLLTEWGTYSQQTKDAIDQLSVHSYRGSLYPAIRDIGKATGKNVWQSEVDGNFGTGFSLTDIQNGIGFSQRIIDDMRELEPDAWVAWQAVEDLYNMKDVSNQSWGAVYIDLDCNAEGHSERRIAAGQTDTACKVETNAKYNAMRNFTHFIRPGDHFIPTSNLNTTAAIEADGTGADVVHVNNGTEPRTVVLNLSDFGNVAASASVTPFITTESPASDVEANALVQGAAVQVDPATKTATLTVPAKSISTFVIDGVAGVSADAHPIGVGGEFAITNKASGLALTSSAGGAVLATASDEPADEQRWTVERVTAGNTHNERVILRNSEGNVLSSDGTASTIVDGGNAATTPSKQWILTTTDGETYELVNADPAIALALTATGTTEGATVAVARSDAPTRTTPLATQVFTISRLQPAPALNIEAGATTKCIAGKALLQVTVKNTDDTPLTIAVETGFGTKTFASVEPGKNGFHSFTTRQVTLPAGAVEVTAIAGTDTVIQTVDYGSRTCS